MCTIQIIKFKFTYNHCQSLEKSFDWIFKVIISVGFVMNDKKSKGKSKDEYQKA